MNENKRSPWAWIPTLYFAQGLPYVAVVTISTIMYKKMGMSNTDIALYTSWLYLPWVIKPLWSPFVDLLKTKRWWIVIMQILIGASFAGIAFSIPTPFYIQATLAIFWLMAFSSATHDIAADGFYMLALDTNEQAKFVGIRSTFYRVATIFGQGVLIILAGFLESSSGADPLAIKVDAVPSLFQSELVVPTDSASSKTYNGEPHFVLDNENIQISTQPIHKDSLKSFLDAIKALNTNNGFVSSDNHAATASAKDKNGNWWTIHVSKPLGNWIKTNFGEDKNTSLSNEVGNVGLATVRLSAKPESAKEMVLNTSLNTGDKSISLIQGERLIFDESNWNKPAYMVFQIDPKLQKASSASYKGLSGNIPFAWSVTFFVLAALFLFFAFYHKFRLPIPPSDKAGGTQTASSILKEFSLTFASFFKKPQALAAIFFMLTFRFAEAQLLKLINPFLLDSRDIGGLGLTTGEVGFVYGTVGIIGLTIGGIVGGFVAAKGGLKKWLWPMMLAMIFTCLTFVYLAYTQTESLLLINICVIIEQFGYGFGFTAYMLYLMYYADGENKTAHYAICTGFMALGMMIPGMFAGWMQEMLGYKHFFVWVMICSLVPIFAASLLKINPNYGKKQEKASDK